MNQVYNKLPDDRPIMSLCIVEDVDKCPKGYTVISKTYDQDSDADLWRESGFFGRKCARYLCLSKTEGFQGFAVQSLIIINEKETPPQDYKNIPKTADSEQKAWRKKQLCYKCAQISISDTSVTDIIVLGRMKKAPEGFQLCGEINGMTICFKIKKNMSLYPQMPYPIFPFNQANTSPDDSFQHNYQNLPPKLPENSLSDGSRPFRPAPKPPTKHSFYSTLSGYNGLEGVPFVLNPKYNFVRNSEKDFSFPKLKTKSEIDDEYRYEFQAERQT